MAACTTSRLRYVSLALPMLLVAMAFSRVASATTVSTPPASSFFLNGLKGQAPTTRYYDFVVSELNGSPDGYSKPMLVVNGELLIHITSYDILTSIIRSMARSYY